MTLNVVQSVKTMCLKHWQDHLRRPHTLLDDNPKPNTLGSNAWDFGVLRDKVKQFWEQHCGIVENFKTKINQR